jgi:hypothetical protein
LNSGNNVAHFVSIATKHIKPIGNKTAINSKTEIKHLATEEHVLRRNNAPEGVLLVTELQRPVSHHKQRPSYAEREVLPKPFIYLGLFIHSFFLPSFLFSSLL